MHLTLYFLGEMEEAEIEGMVAILSERVGGGRGAAGASPSPVGRRTFDLEVSGLILLPEPRVPRVIAAGIGGEVEQLRLLQQRLSDTVFPLAAFKEKRGFSPHVTIGRLRQGMPGNAKALKRTLAEVALADLPRFVVGEFELVSSVLGKQGPTYETVHRFALS
jgi:2'-5' RNA ligase